MSGNVHHLFPQTDRSGSSKHYTNLSLIATIVFISIVSSAGSKSLEHIYNFKKNILPYYGVIAGQIKG